MHTYCTNCGAKKEDNGKLLCDECLSRAETASAAEMQQPKAAAKPDALQWNQYWDAVKNFAVRPMETMRAACAEANVTHAAVIALAASLVMALFGMLMLRRVWYAVFGIFGGGPGFDLSRVLMGAFSFPYGEVFLKLLLLYIVQWLLLALLITGLGRWFGLSVRIAESLNAVAYTKLILTAGTVAAFVLSLIYTPLAIAITAAAMLAGYLLIDRTVSEHAHIPSVKRVYFMPAVVAVYFTALFILSRLFF